MFYFAGGFVATITQTLMTLAFGTVAETRVPNLGASGAIAAVLGAYFVIYPNSRVRRLIVVFPVQLSAWFFLGAWFLYQLIEANFRLFGAAANGGGVAFFANVSGFVSGVIVTLVLAPWTGGRSRGHHSRPLMLPEGPASAGAATPGQPPRPVLVHVRQAPGAGFSAPCLSQLRLFRLTIS